MPSNLNLNPKPARPQYDLDVATRRRIMELRPWGQVVRAILPAPRQPSAARAASGAARANPRATPCHPLRHSRAASAPRPASHAPPPRCLHCKGQPRAGTGPVLLDHTYLVSRYLVSRYLVSRYLGVVVSAAPHAQAGGLRPRGGGSEAALFDSPFYFRTVLF